jgi:hypothetical protein
MINFNLVLHNLWCKENFKSIWDKSGSFTKHKHWELQLTRYKPEYIGLSVDTRWRGHDHAGISVELILLGYHFDARLYDSRHWDYTNNCWMTYTEEEKTC